MSYVNLESKISMFHDFQGNTEIPYRLKASYRIAF
jgi:hypothetical protein